LRDLVVCLGDHIGLTDDEIELAVRLGGEVGGGGPVLRASLGKGALLASQCLVIANHYLDQIHECPSQLWEVSPELKHFQRQRQRRVKRKAGKRERKLDAPVDAAASGEPRASESDGEEGER